MKKITLSLTIVFNVIILTLIAINFSESSIDKQSTVFGQNNNTANSNSTKYTDLFSSKAYQTCSVYTPDFCTQTIKVIHESPTTIVLTSEYSDALWQAVDMIKRDGYKMDGFNSYSAEAALSSQPSIHTTVVLS